MFKVSLSQLSSRGKLVRWGILGFSFTPLFGTYFYNQGYKIQFLVCPIRYFTGIPCPGCGMTSSFMALGKGNLMQAVTENLFGPLLFLGFLLATIHVTLELLIQHKITAFYLQIIKLKKLQILGLCTVIIYYSLRIYYLSQTGELYFAFIHSPVFKILTGYF